MFGEVEILGMIKKIYIYYKHLWNLKQRKIEQAHKY